MADTLSKTNEMCTINAYVPFKQKFCQRFWKLFFFIWGEDDFQETIGRRLAWFWQHFFFVWRSFLLGHVILIPSAVDFFMTVNCRSIPESEHRSDNFVSGQSGLIDCHVIHKAADWRSIIGRRLIDSIA